MSDVTVYLPATSGDQITEWMIALTEKVCVVTGLETGYGLGGRFGYGENYENDVFMMHRYCWCEMSDCPWCRSCDCMDAEQCATSCKSNIPAAPNFLHKASGATVHWYKYIGRDMQVSEANWPEILTDCFASLEAGAAP